MEEVDHGVFAEKALGPSLDDRLRIDGGRRTEHIRSI
jgi:hypothetical protein